MLNIWIYVVLAAYLINAVVFVVDKYLLALPIPKPFAYAFWSAILSSIVLLFPVLFDISFHGIIYTLVAVLSGSLFFAALVSLYMAVQKTDISIACTEVGIVTAVSTFLFSTLILGEFLSLQNAMALGFLILGMFFLGKANGRTIIKYSLIAGVLFGLSFVLLKWTFDASDLANGIYWTRIGFIGSALLSLVSRRGRLEIASSARKTPLPSKALFVGNKALSGTGFLLLYYAIRIGSVTFINALLGFQFLFVLIMAVLLQKKIPSVRENLERSVLTRKLVGIALVITGFLLI